MKTEKYTESEVREQRDKVYGFPISDKEWENCKDNWMEELEAEWLFGQPKS
jgi:hypothetical protein